MEFLYGDFRACFKESYSWFKPLTQNFREPLCLPDPAFGGPPWFKPPVAAVVAPPQAIAAGFTELNFAQEPGTWDIGYDTGIGHRWCPALWWYPLATPDSFTIDANGFLIITDNTGVGGTGTNICTQFYDYSGGIYFEGGYFEAMMWCTDWSAFWLYCAQGPTHTTVPGDPSTYNNEVDIIETDPGPAYANIATTTIHLNTGGNGGIADQINPNNNNAIPNPPITEAWHKFGCLWTTTDITWYVDDVPVCTAPVFSSTNQPATLILGVGNGGVNGSPSNIIPPVVKIQWVRVWEPPGYVNPPL